MSKHHAPDLIDRLHAVYQRFPVVVWQGAALAAAIVWLVALATLGVAHRAVADPPPPSSDATAGTEAPASEAAEAPPAGGGTPSPSRASRTELIGFYVNWDDASYNSLRTNLHRLTKVMPEWYTIDSKGRVRATNPSKQRRAMRLIRSRRPGLEVVPMVNNFGSGQDPKVLARILANGPARRRLAADIVRLMRAGGFDGVNIDFEGIPASSRRYLTAFMAELYPRAKRAGLEVSIDVLVDSRTYDYRALAARADYLIPMLYDQHWKTSPAGPISSQQWYERKLAKFFRQVPPKKTVVALGVWTYEWRTGRRRASSHTYREALAIARRTRTPVKLDRFSLNPTFAYRSAGVHHRVWMLDASTMFNQIKSVSDSRPRGYAIWRLGAEDPAVWRVLPKRDSLGAREAASLKPRRGSIRYDAKRGLITARWQRP